jgi:ABC-2 type transport system ATP-binding protein
MEGNSIELLNLVKRFGSLVAVNDVTLKISRGEFFGLLGPNGAGKTTIINIIMGLLDPTSGRVIVDNIDAKKGIEKIRQRIGFVTQETIIEPELTAIANMRLFGRLYHVPEDVIEKRAHELLKMVDLENFSNMLAGVMSGGMQRRLAVAKALIHEPSILILDEPTTGLDIQNRTKFWELLERINKEKKITILLTTQYLEEADKLCERIAVIYHGKIVAIGSPSELKRSISRGSVLEISVEKNDMQKVLDTAKSFFKQVPKQQGDRILINVEDNAVELMDKFIKLVEAKHIKIVSISMHQPTLDDVFLKLTGSSLRDSASSEPISRATMMRRMR